MTLRATGVAFRYSTTASALPGEHRRAMNALSHGAPAGACIRRATWEALERRAVYPVVRLPS